MYFRVKLISNHQYNSSPQNLLVFSYHSATSMHNIFIHQSGEPHERAKLGLNVYLLTITSRQEDRPRRCSSPFQISLCRDLFSENFPPSLKKFLEPLNMIQRNHCV